MQRSGAQTSRGTFTLQTSGSRTLETELSGNNLDTARQVFLQKTNNRKGSSISMGLSIFFQEILIYFRSCPMRKTIPPLKPGKIPEE